MKTNVPLITIALVCFAVVQNTQALSPPPDGGYPGGNTAEGQNALTGLTTGFYNNAVGIYALLIICIGANFDGADVNNSCFIGNIRDVTTQNADAIPVLIDSAGQLGTATSSARFKKDIKPLDKASETILALKPV